MKKKLAEFVGEMKRQAVTAAPGGHWPVVGHRANGLWSIMKAYQMVLRDYVISHK